MELNNQTIYLASPWFNDEQAEREDRIKSTLRSLGFNVWSPKENCKLSPITDPAVRQKVFDSNCKNIENCSIIFAITDGKDMGTIWEAGYAAGLNSKDPDNHPDNHKVIIYYCETLGNGLFNLMLAQSGDIVITSYDDLKNLPEMLKEEKLDGYVGIVE